MICEGRALRPSQIAVPERAALGRRTRQARPPRAEGRTWPSSPVLGGEHPAEEDRPARPSARDSRARRQWRPSAARSGTSIRERRKARRSRIEVLLKVNVNGRVKVNVKVNVKVKVNGNS